MSTAAILRRRSASRRRRCIGPPAQPPSQHGAAAMIERTAATAADALVLFGATGDLAKRKLFPALYHMERARRAGGAGDRRRPQRLDRRRRSASTPARRSASSSTEPRAAVIKRLCKRLDLDPGRLRRHRHVDRRCATRSTATTRRPPCFYMAIPPSMFPTVAESLASVGLNERGRIVVEKPFGRDLAVGPRAQRRAAPGASRRTTSSASTTTSARSRSRTCWCSASPTRCSSRCGTGATCAACRSRCRRRSASRDGARSTTRSARSATCSRTTCCRSWRCWRWSRPSATRPSYLQDEKVKVFAATEAARLRRRSCAASTTATATSPASPPDSHDRDVRRRHAADRLVAVGRRAVVRPRRQGAWPRRPPRR